MDAALHADCIAAGKDQTVRRARPLALRRAITFRPFLVLMRFRNPCSRLRLRFEGCLKVNDIAHSFSRDQFQSRGGIIEAGVKGVNQTAARLIPPTAHQQPCRAAQGRKMSSRTTCTSLRHSCAPLTNMPQNAVGRSINHFSLNNDSRKENLSSPIQCVPGTYIAFAVHGSGVYDAPHRRSKVTSLPTPTWQKLGRARRSAVMRDRMRS
jgi:hypothetical protein